MAHVLLSYAVCVCNWIESLWFSRCVCLPVALIVMWLDSRYTSHLAAPVTPGGDHSVSRHGTTSTDSALVARKHDWYAQSVENKARAICTVQASKQALISYPPIATRVRLAVGVVRSGIDKPTYDQAEFKALGKRCVHRPVFLCLTLWLILTLSPVSLLSSTRRSRVVFG